MVWGCWPVDLMCCRYCLTVSVVLHVLGLVSLRGECFNRGVHAGLNGKTSVHSVGVHSCCSNVYLHLLCRNCYEVACDPTGFSDNYGNYLDRKSACHDASASLVVRITDTCPCNYAGNSFSNKRW